MTALRIDICVAKPASAPISVRTVSGWIWPACLICFAIRMAAMLRPTATIIITGFGPFPGAPYNPTDPLVSMLARRRRPAFAGVRRIAHVFRVSYEAVDRELPELLAREQPDVLVMFGLAMRTRHIRIE